MFKKSARSTVALLAVVAVALLAWIGRPGIAAASGGTLFGLANGMVVKVDPATAALTTFAVLPQPPPPQLGASFNSLASDGSHHKLYLVRSTISADFTSVAFQLVTVDTESAAVSISPDMASGVGSLVFDPVSGGLFGQTNVCCPFQLVRVDPSTGVQTHVADMPGVQPLRLAVAPAQHAIYFATESFVLGQFQPVITMVTVDETTGAVTQSPPLDRGVVFLAYDTSLGRLFGKTFCCPADLVQVDPLTGAEAPIATGLGLGGAMTIDSATHTIYSTDDVLSPFSFDQFIQTINDQTGAISVSTGPVPSNDFVNELAFEGVTITPESIKTDVKAAFASGAIDNAGIADSLLAKLDAAASARAGAVTSGARTNGCATAAAIYQAFINEVTSLSGGTVSSTTRPHILAAAAAQLISEARF